MKVLRKLFQARKRRQLRKLAKKFEFGMTVRQEQAWLRNYAAESYRGLGAIVDLGCFLGATTIALAEGLALNRKAKNQQIHAYDLFVWDKFCEGWAKGTEVDGLFAVGASFLPEFLRRTEKWRGYIVAHQEDLSNAQWEGGPIEFLFVDAMKTPEIATAVASNFFPHLIPGKSLLAHQDFAHYFTVWIHFLTFRLRYHFRFVEDLPQSSLFLLEREIEPEILTSDLSPSAVSPDEIETAFDYSLSLVSDEKKGNVIAAKAMAYVGRGDLARAHEVIVRSRYGPTSFADEFNTVKTLIERNLVATESSPP
jgi:hypothetical protein